MAFGLLSYFIHRANNETDQDFSSEFDGLNLDINPDKLIDSVLKNAEMPPKMKNFLSHGIKQIIFDQIAKTDDKK